MTDGLWLFSSAVFTLILIQDSPGSFNQWGIAGLFVTTVAAFLTNVYNRRADLKVRETDLEAAAKLREADLKSAEQKHQWDVEARKAVADGVKAALEARAADLQAQLDKTAALSRLAEHQASANIVAGLAITRESAATIDAIADQIGSGATAAAAFDAIAGKSAAVTTLPEATLPEGDHAA
jgi:hypothetical protein